VALTAYHYDRCVYDITDIFSSYRNSFLSIRWYIFLTFGVFVGTAAALWLEDVVGYAKQYAITAGVVLLWGLYCFSLPAAHEEYQNYNVIQRLIEIIGVGLAASLSIYFISFLKKDTDTAFWNFAVRVAFQYNIAACFGVIVFAGLCGALLAAGALFNLDIPTRAYTHLMSLCLILFAHLYFLANIPGKDVKYDNEIRINGAVKSLGLYVMAPLVAVYAFILYAYLFKIILIWELPQGWVSWLVSSLAAGGLLTVMILYPLRMEEKNRTAVHISRYFGVAMLPLLALMTVGIFRRVGDYGLTVRRGYLILINIWLYWACLYHFFTKARRVKWLFISFTAVAMLSCLRLCGVPAITKYILTAEIRGYAGNQKFSLTDKALFDKMGHRNRVKAVKKIEYLRYTYGFDNVATLFENDVNEDNFWDFLRMWESDAMPKPDTATADKDAEADAPKPEKRDYGEYFSLRRRWRNRNWDIEGYNAVAFIGYPQESGKDERIRMDFNDNHLTVAIGGIKKQGKTFHIQLLEKARSSVNGAAPEMYLRGNGYTLLIDRLYGRYYKSADSIELHDFDGYLFYNQ
jgi:hypothetical protein